MPWRAFAHLKTPHLSREKLCVADHQPMPVVGVPNVVVRKVVHVSLELTPVHVDVGDKQKRNVKYAIYTTSA